MWLGVSNQPETEMKTVSCQTEMSGEDLARLERELQEHHDQVGKLKQTVQDVQKNLEKQSLGCEALKEDNRLLKFYTGMIVFINYKEVNACMPIYGETLYP